MLAGVEGLEDDLGVVEVVKDKFDGVDVVQYEMVVTDLAEDDLYGVDV